MSAVSISRAKKLFSENLVIEQVTVHLIFVRATADRRIWFKVSYVPYSDDWCVKSQYIQGIPSIKMKRINVEEIKSHVVSSIFDANL